MPRLSPGVMGTAALMQAYGTFLALSWAYAQHTCVLVSSG